MATRTLTMKIRKILWNQNAITERVEWAKRTILSKSGSRMRKMQRKMIRPRRIRNTANPPNNSRQRNQNKRIWMYGRENGRYQWTEISQPGNPPFWHPRDMPFGIRSIEYDVNEKRDSVIMGPLGKMRAGGGMPTPEVLEKGGVVRKRLKSRKGQKARYQTRRIAARPSAVPTLNLFRVQYPDMWRDSVNSATPRIRRPGR